jgi:hypothetical protein
MGRSPFFDGVGQVDVKVDGMAAKLPIFYYDGTAMTALFVARWRELRRVLPDPRFVPARLAPGLGVVGITCFEYRDTDIGPYNELAVSILLNEPWFLPNLPGQALARGLVRKQLHAFVHHLPVTTEVARATGVGYWGYPKFVAGIDFEESAGRRTCRLSEDGEEILTLSARDIPTPRADRLRIFSHLYQDRLPQSSEFDLNVAAMGRTSRPVATLELGRSHPIAAELSRLLVSRRAFHYQLLRRFEGILYGPDRLSLPLLEWARGSIEAARPAKPAKAAKAA